MTGQAQAHAYAHADFSVPHAHIIHCFQSVFPKLPSRVQVIDLGCGPGDIAIRLARLYKGWQIDALDGSAAMLSYGKRMVEIADLQQRIHFRQSTLPDKQLPEKQYDIVVSNSLLHHLHKPQVLWDTITVIAKPRAAVFIADLRRPDSREELEDLVDRYAGNEPEVLRRDFHNSLFAAFTPEEVSAQLRQAGLSAFQVKAVGDRHLLIYGLMNAGHAS